MADSFDAAAADVQARRAALLKAIAEGGTAGRQQYEAAQAKTTEARTAAVGDALKAAATRGAPASAQQTVSATVATPYDRATPDLAAGQQAHTNLLSGISAANDNYMGQVASGIPVVREIANMRVAKRKADDALHQRELDLEGRRLGLSERELAMREKELANGGNVGDIIQRYGGSEVLGAQLNAGGDDYTRIEKSDPYSYKRGANGPGSAPASDAALHGQGVEVVGRDLGLPAGVSTALAGGGVQDRARDAAAQDALNQIAAKKARQTIYNGAKTSASKSTFFEFEKALQQPSPSEAVRYVNGLKADYLKRNGISRSALLNWVQRYMAI